MSDSSDISSISTLASQAFSILRQSQSSSNTDPENDSRENIQPPIERRQSKVNLSKYQRLQIYSALVIARDRQSCTATPELLYAAAHKVLQETQFKEHFLSTPTMKTIKSIWTNVGRTRKISTDRSKAGRPKKPIREEIEFMIAEDNTLSSRRIANQLNASQTTVTRAIEELKDKSFKEAYGPELLENHIIDREDFAIDMHNMLENGDLSHRDIIFVDEKMQTSGLYINKQNKRFYGFRGISKLSRPGINVRYRGEQAHIFVALHSTDGAIGPFFVDEIPVLPEDKGRTTLTKERYVRLLDDTIFPAIKDKIGEYAFNRCWFQQDGATPHAAHITRACLTRHFGHRLISTGCRLIWPAHSPGKRVYSNTWP